MISMVTEEYSLPFLVTRVCPAVMAAIIDAKLQLLMLIISSLPLSSPFPPLSLLFCIYHTHATEAEGNDKPLKIIQTIAAGDYMTFGMYLLQDDNGWRWISSERIISKMVLRLSHSPSY